MTIDVKEQLMIDTFRAQRDIDLFVGQQLTVAEHPRGFLAGATIFTATFTQNAQVSVEPDRHKHVILKLQNIQAAFMQWLGQSKPKNDLEGIAPSRFSNTNPNGLWEYSPFLCGVGLMEGLELAYLAGMTGYLKKPVGIFQNVSELFEQRLFVGGKPPSSNFADAFWGRKTAAGVSSEPPQPHIADLPQPGCQSVSW
ncbi:hypothetical protein VTJ49DRAFT_3152 [Mycothermus thermophilus]|uniref:Uncharacterized protein n=1 Tax=Humicola insolens TaxID=85995 RepID=A0ABR3V857_HUMIN